MRLPAEAGAQKIAKLEAGDLPPGQMMLGVADPAIFASDGGPSIAERMQRAGVQFRPADNKRVPGAGAMGGWDQLRARLIGVDAKPMLYVFSTCTHLIRTLPALQHDENRPEDVDTDGEDHAADELRYACMSRPWTPPLRRATAEGINDYGRGSAARKPANKVSWKVA